MNRTIYIKTTESCNLSCKHCFTGGDTPKRYFFKPDKIIDWIDRFMAYVKTEDITHFEFHGGEPMLAPLKDIIKVASHIESIRQIRAESDITLGMVSNLVYRLNKAKLDFILNGIDFIGTSYDPDIRFKNQAQLDLWLKNVRTIREHGKNITLFISVSNTVVDMDQKELLKFVRDLGVNSLHFERITYNGNAKDNLDLFPSNKRLDKWFLDLHEASESLGARKWFDNTTLESVYAKFEAKFRNCGTYCRDCQEKMFTINANGTIAGCPNSAPVDIFGHISQDIETMLSSNRRVEQIVKEKERNPNCYSCPVFRYCNSDCFKLDWQGDVCPAPKSLMFKLKKQKDMYTEKRLKELQSGVVKVCPV